MDATGYINTAVNIKDVSHKFYFDTYLIPSIFLSLHIFCVSVAATSLGNPGHSGSPCPGVIGAGKWKDQMSIFFTKYFN